MAIQREVAHRVFAEEFNASRHTVKESDDEKAPTFLVTPTGAKVNRAHVVGVCTDVEPVGESGDVHRARISDPTGVFTVYAGQFQPEAAQALADLQPPCFVAVTGKARTYEPEPGSLFVSLRPETITLVEEDVRDQWILDTARRSVERLKAIEQVRGMESPTADALVAAGIRPPVAQGTVLATQGYTLDDTARYWQATCKALEGLLPGGEITVHTTTEAPSGDTGMEAPTWTPPAETKEDADPASDALDERILAVVQQLEGDTGARWDDILDEAKKAEPPTGGEEVEESLNRLMDKGLVYEPTLGVLRTT